MGLEKFKRPVYAAGLRYPVQALTRASTGTAVTPHGLTTITSTGGTAGVLVFSLSAPVPGCEKSVVVDIGSTREVQLRTASSAAPFFGSTFNAVLFTTAGSTTLKFVRLTGVSTSQWAITGRSTAITLQAATA